jgi:hypothetical protein
MKLSKRGCIGLFAEVRGSIRQLSSYLKGSYVEEAENFFVAFRSQIQVQQVEFLGDKFKGT